ncbi:hypothetical protein [Modestobacter altitudinis]|uniref:hypothetical protein n=1 Tax=Modestobacter altitudinis TaxID=2213158 RepID=UPI00110C9F2D|nr:hypothetical protein [Modestobacter altitudinis]
MVGLERLLNGEERVSDFVAFLADLDPQPLARVLGLDAEGLKVRREALVNGRGGRADLLVENAAGEPLALVEVKIGAGQHGRQYAVYDEWAAQDGLSASCWLVTLSGDDPHVPPSWHTGLTLAGLVGEWRKSDHAQAAWLADLAAAVLERRAEQLEGRLGLAQDRVVADLLVKRLKASLRRSPTADRLDLALGSGMRTNGGAPMLLGWWSIGTRAGLDVFMTLDLRADNPRPRAWVLRLGLEVDPRDVRDSAEARVLAHDLATPIAARLSRTALVATLNEDQQALAAALVPRKRGWHDGLSGNPSPRRLADWRSAASAGEPTGKHPMLFSDSLYNGGLRLASQLPVDAAELDWRDMLELMEVSLDHLASVAADVTVAPVEE